MSQMNHVVSMHHDGSSHSPQHMVSMHDSSDHYQSMSHDSQMSEPSSPESPTFDDTDLLNSSVADVVTSQLAAAGPIGVAAAAAVATGRKRKRPHSFETNPSIRKRQQTRLLRKLKGTVDEYATRVGQQVVVLCACPSRPNPLFKVFGAAPLENCVKSLKPHILQSLETALSQQTPQPSQDNNGLFELPPLVIDGIPTPVDKMTQAQLRAFIPLMLKYSTGRGKPGWARDATKPAWWPDGIPWQNVRSDTRSEDQKAKLSWTNALRMIVKNCYEFHGRSDLLPDFHDGETPTFQQVQTSHPMVHTLTNADGTLSLVQVDASGAIVSSYTDGSTQAESTQAVATLSEVAATTQGTPVTISISEMSHSQAAAQAAVATLAEATLADGGQLVLPEHAAAALGESPLNTSTMVTIPVHAAAAMMQIQNSQINQSATYITTSIPQVAMAPHTAMTAVSSSPPQQLQAQLVETTNVDTSVPGASQAVEVVTYSN